MTKDEKILFLIRILPTGKTENEKLAIAIDLLDLMSDKLNCDIK
jgi:hypothetical protein